VSPEVKAAYQVFSKFTLLVISFMRTGANLFCLNFLWMHKKLTEAIFLTSPLRETLVGKAEINASNLLVFPVA